MAGKLLAKRSQQALKHNDSGKSEASIFMPPPPSAEDMGGAQAVAAAAGRPAAMGCAVRVCVSMVSTLAGYHAQDVHFQCCAWLS